MSKTAKLYPAAGTLPRLVTSTTDFVILRDMIALFALGSFARNQYVGGSDTDAIAADTTGDKELPHWFPFILDNTSSQLSGFNNGNGGTLVVQVRFFVRVSDTAINVTPKIVYGTSIGALSSVATISGQAACSATNSDYTGSNQVQTVALTLPSGAQWFKPLITVAGTPSTGDLAYARAVLDLYINS